MGVVFGCLDSFDIFEIGYPLCLYSFDRVVSFEGLRFGCWDSFDSYDTFDSFEMGFSGCMDSFEVLADLIVLRDCVLGVWTVLKVLSVGVLSVRTILTVLS